MLIKSWINRSHLLWKTSFHEVVNGEQGFFSILWCNQTSNHIWKIYILGTWGTCRELIKNLMKIQCELNGTTKIQHFNSPPRRKNLGLVCCFMLQQIKFPTYVLSYFWPRIMVGAWTTGVYLKSLMERHLCLVLEGPPLVTLCLFDCCFDCSYSSNKHLV
jgi:hypothetical protein